LLLFIAIGQQAGYNVKDFVNIFAKVVGKKYCRFMHKRHNGAFREYIHIAKLLAENGNHT
jgi:hypothetical protein